MCTAWPGLETKACKSGGNPPLDISFTQLFLAVLLGCFQVFTEPNLSMEFLGSFLPVCSSLELSKAQNRYWKSSPGTGPWENCFIFPPLLLTAERMLSPWKPGEARAPGQHGLTPLVGTHLTWSANISKQRWMAAPYFGTSCLPSFLP